MTDSLKETMCGFDDRDRYCLIALEVLHILCFHRQSLTKSVKDRLKMWTLLNVVEIMNLQK